MYYILFGHYYLIYLLSFWMNCHLKENLLKIKNWAIILFHSVAQFLLFRVIFYAKEFKKYNIYLFY